MGLQYLGKVITLRRDFCLGILASGILLLSSCSWSEVGSKLKGTDSNPNPGTTATAILVQKLLQDYHFAGYPMTEEKARAWIKNYMEALDYNHTFFLAGDLKNYQDTYGPQLVAMTTRGNITPAFDIFSGFNARVRQRLTWIKQRLTQPFDFNSQQSYELDRTKVGWPETQADADDLWERRLKFDFLRERLAASKKSAKESSKPKETPLNTISKRYDRLIKNLDDYDNETISELYLTSLSALYDPHSSYMSASTLEDFSISMKLALVGIGAVLASEDGYCVIKELIPGGPADLDSRLKVGDKIIGVAQGDGPFEDIVDMKLRNAVKKIRGPKKTIVRLQVMPAGSSAGEQREIQITRDEVKLVSSQASAAVFEVPKSGPAEGSLDRLKSDSSRSDATTSQWWKDLISKFRPETPSATPVIPVSMPEGKSDVWKVGVIDLPSFYGNVGGEGASSSGNGAIPRETSKDVLALIQQFNRANVDGLILDLRKNGGGLLDEAVSLTGLFIDQGPVVQVKDNKGTVLQRTDDVAGELYRGPLLVLTGRRSASASEIVAGALQNYGRAIIVGEKSTHGKGTVQAVVELDKFLTKIDKNPPKAGAVKLTIQKFYLPNGHSTQNRGVIPDISIPSPLDYMKIGESDLPNALAWDEIGPSRFSPETFDPSMRAILADKSRQRLASDKDMEFLQKDIDKVKSRLETGSISLNETARLEEKKVDDQRNDDRKKVEDRITASIKPVVRLVIDDKKGVTVTDKDPKKKKPSIEESADGEAEDITDAIDLTETLELREALAIMTDWLNLRKTLQESSVAKGIESPKDTVTK